MIEKQERFIDFSSLVLSLLQLQGRTHKAREFTCREITSSHEPKLECDVHRSFVRRALSRQLAAESRRRARCPQLAKDVWRPGSCRSPRRTSKSIATRTEPWSFLPARGNVCHQRPANRIRNQRRKKSRRDRTTHHGD